MDARSWLGACIIALSAVFIVLAGCCLRVQTGGSRYALASVQAATPMVAVPAGDFHFGPDNKVVRLGAFWIDKYEVTKDDYSRFVRASGVALRFRRIRSTTSRRRALARRLGEP
jgi:formylglycine-generating enzyme required for sulfatase activity